MRMCSHCFCVMNTGRSKHVCGYIYCAQCRSSHMRNELCYVQPIPNDFDATIEGMVGEESIEYRRRSKYLFVFYDFETRQDEAYIKHDTTTLHIPVLCVAQQVCSDCENLEDVSVFCNTCGIRQHVLENDPVNELIRLYVRPKTDIRA